MNITTPEREQDAPARPEKKRTSKPGKVIPSALEEERRHLIAIGVRRLILQPQYKAFQIVMVGMLTYRIAMCEGLPPKGKYASLAKLGHQSSCGHDLYYLVEWDDGSKTSVMTEFWEEGDHRGRLPYYYPRCARQQMIKNFKRKQAGKPSGDEPKTMVRKGGPSGIAWFPREFRDQVIAEERARLVEALAQLPA